jgi:hypothetical protein
MIKKTGTNSQNRYQLSKNVTIIKNRYQQSNSYEYSKQQVGII